MSYTISTAFLKSFFLSILYLWQPATGCSQSALDTVFVTIPSGRMDYMETFNEVGRQTGYYFMYDSQLLDARARTRIRRGQYALLELVSMLLRDKMLDFNTMDRYIILFKAGNDRRDILEEPSGIADHYTAKGRVKDASSGVPLPFASVLLTGQNKGVSSNSDGQFRFSLSGEFLYDTVRISFMGYAPRYIPVILLINGQMDIYMEIESVSLDEIMVPWFDPLVILREAIEKIPVNYQSSPSGHKSFYREGTFKSDRVLNYSEAVFHVYKTGYSTQSPDQVRLLKSRKITNATDRDTLMLKLQAGVKSMLELDVIKYPPDFLTESYLHNLVFTHSGYEWYNSGLVYVIDFEKAPFAPERIYYGRIFIERESRDIIRVDFGVKNEFLRRNQNRFLPRRSKGHITQIRSMDYSVRYQRMGNYYHIAHVRGDIEMRIRERGKISGNRFRAFFEMATLEVDTCNAGRPGLRERFRTNTIFADHNFHYDPDFWEGFSFIQPEESLHKAMQVIHARIESTVEED